MPEYSKKIIKELSEELKSFNKTFSQIGNNPENISQDSLEALKDAQRNISISTRRYLETLKVDPKILQAINSLISQREEKYDIYVKQQEEKRKDSIKQSLEIAGKFRIAPILENPEPLEPNRKLYDGTSSEKKQDFIDSINYILGQFRATSNYEFPEKYDAEIKMMFFQVSPSPIETIKNIRDLFATLSNNPRALRLEKSGGTIEDLQRLQILWQGASIIADESNAHYFKRNLIVAAEAIIRSLCGGIVGIVIVVNMAIMAVVKIAELAKNSLINLATLHPRAAASDIGKSFGVLISVPMAALPVIFTQFYTCVVSGVQDRKNAQELELLDQALKKVIAVFNAVETVEKQIKANSKEGPQPKPASEI